MYKVTKSWKEEFSFLYIFICFYKFLLLKIVISRRIFLQEVGFLYSAYFFHLTVIVLEWIKKNVISYIVMSYID